MSLDARKPVAKTKAQISCAVVFLFAYVKSRFSHDRAQRKTNKVTNETVLRNELLHDKKNKICAAS